MLFCLQIKRKEEEIPVAAENYEDPDKNPKWIEKKADCQSHLQFWYSTPTTNGIASLLPLDRIGIDSIASNIHYCKW